VTLTRRRFGQSLLSLGAASALPVRGAQAAEYPWVTADGKLKIGLLWSLTGVLEVIERPSHDACLFWADKVNRNGGVAGMQVEPIVIDAASDMAPYRDGITQLMDQGVLASFGGYTSISRRAVMPLVAQRDHLFYYPTIYEGRECWQNVICTGALANQHSYELVPYMVKRFGPRVYFIGSNYIWPKESNRNARNWLERVNGELVAERYVPLGMGDFEEILADVKAKQPDWIFSTVVGDSDVYFRQKYIQAGFRPDTMPTAALTTSEAEVAAMGAEFGDGHFVSAPYFQSLDSPTNRSFVEEFLDSPYGSSGVTQSNMETTYLSLLFFQKAVEKIVAEEGMAALTPRRVRDVSGGMELGAAESPQGLIRVDPDNFNAWVTPKIGRFDNTGQVDVLQVSKELVPPKPFLLYPSRGECKADGLHLPNGKIVPNAA
jgi:urea transport system substrate-binding protein